MESVAKILGKKFVGALIEDPVIEPYFITCEAGAYTISKKRIDGTGALRYSDVCYPSTFEGCLTRIAKEKLAEGKTYASLQEYIDEWHRIVNEISEAVRASGTDKL